MLTETQKMILIDDLEKYVEYRYPLTSGTTQYDYNPNMFVYRDGEPVKSTYPAVKVKFHPKTATQVAHPTVRTFL